MSGKHKGKVAKERQKLREVEEQDPRQREIEKLQKRIAELERLAGKQTAELDFFVAALRSVKERARRAARVPTGDLSSD